MVSSSPEKALAALHIVKIFPQEAADHHQDPRLHLRRHGDLQERPQPLLPRRLVRALPAQQELKLLLLQISLEVDGHLIHVAGRWISFYLLLKAYYDTVQFSLQAKSRYFSVARLSIQKNGEEHRKRKQTLNGHNVDDDTAI